MLEGKGFYIVHKKAIKFIIELHCMKSGRNKYNPPKAYHLSPV